VTVALVLALIGLAWGASGIWSSLRHRAGYVSSGLSSRTAYMQITVSLILLGVGLYVILSKQYATADTNWACGTVGTVIGFWLKGK
jgi:hypothetical protein